MTRREFILKTGIAALAVLSQSALVLPLQAIAGESDIKISKASLSLKHFYALSSWITYQADLDRDTAEKMFNVFKDETWGPEHIVQIYNKIAPLIYKGSEPLDFEKLLKSSTFFDEGERWFISHLVTTWYLGIYYHEDHSTQRITYGHALMYKIGTPDIPIPYIGAVPFEEWSHPPEGSEQ
ncbi:MAG: sugar dehydrogenase complex small subunit [Alphaproteobacteria bacterium]